MGLYRKNFLTYSQENLASKSSRSGIQVTTFSTRIQPNDTINNFRNISISHDNPSVSRKKIYICAKCGAHLALASWIESKYFTCHHGRAYLFNDLHGEAEEKELRTGLHLVSQSYCMACDSYLGWYYQTAFEERERYKEGMVVLERHCINFIYEDDEYRRFDSDDMISD